jgi:hypothetical protein
MDMHLNAPDLTPAPGRFPFPLGGGWIAVAIIPWPGMVALGLFLDGEPVEILEDDDAREHIARLVRAGDQAVEPRGLLGPGHRHRGNDRSMRDGHRRLPLLRCAGLAGLCVSVAINTLIKRAGDSRW